MTGPEQSDVDALRDLLDLMADFSSNDQRARYLLTCNWMRDRGAQVAEQIRADLAELDDRSATLEIGWIAREALALSRENVPLDSERGREYIARKRAVLAHIARTETDHPFC